ncbi:MAG: multifunctional fatty acid oxidation complex subunit alpha, partial [Planctomycetaceae bacterium]|nr:multifunctional fatty acid oxidation complex subunit alpha [Planctomycetaceae bacterium]
PSIMSVVVLEATNILTHEIVADPRDIDLCIINGLSFPNHLGGILFWADQFGIDRINSYLDQMVAQIPKRVPSQMLRQMATDGTRFY